MSNDVTTHAVLGTGTVGQVNTALANRVMRKLRKTLFRPRFEEGEPVDTETIVRAYEIK